MGSTEACFVSKKKPLMEEEIEATLGFLKIVSVPQNPPNEEPAPGQPVGKGEFKWQLKTFRVFKIKFY